MNPLAPHRPAPAQAAHPATSHDDAVPLTLSQTIRGQLRPPPRSDQPGPADRSAQRRMSDSFGGRLSLRTKLLLLSLIPLIPLALFNAGSLWYVSRLHGQDLDSRLARVGEQWQARLTQLATLSARTATSLATSKAIERALRRNDWDLARRTLQAAVVADPDLRAMLVDADGRLLADTWDRRFDVPLQELPLVARALAGQAGADLLELGGTPCFGYARSVQVVGGVEGMVWVGLPLEPQLLARFTEVAHAALILEHPEGGRPLLGTVPLPAVLPDPPVGLELAVPAGQGPGRTFRFAPVATPLPDSPVVLTSYVGLDQAELASTIRQQLVTLATAFLLLLAVILGVTLTLARRVVQALGFVVEKMRLLLQGQYEKIDPVRGRDEIAFLGHGFNEMIDGLIERDFVRQTFGRYMSRDVAQAVLDHPGGLKLGGEARQVTILFSDLRGFTALSARQPPETVVYILNVYLGRMAEVIEQYQGTVNEFLGDGILALFGAPVAQPDDALRAVACAVAMQRAMPGVNERLRDLGIPPLRMGIGLASGTVVAGNIGSETRVKYGVVGLAVNLASRVESCTLGDDVLVDRSTLDAADPRFLRVGPPREVTVKGADRPVTIHPVLGVGLPYSLELPAQMTEPPRLCPLPGGAQAQIWLIQDKQLSGAPRRVTARALGPLDLELDPGSTPWPAWSDLKLQLCTPTAETSTELYGKVAETREEAGGTVQRIRLTRISEEDRLVLDGWLTASCRSAEP